MSEDLRDFLFGGAILVLLVALTFFVVAGLAWQFRNPLANSSTVFTHFRDVLRFKRDEQFQEHRP